MTDDWKVFVIHYSEGDPIAVCAPDFGCAIAAAIQDINQDTPTAADDFVTLERFMGWICRVEIVSEDPIIVWTDPAAAPEKHDRAAALEAHIMAIGQCLAARDLDAAWEEYGRASNEIQGTDALPPTCEARLPPRSAR